MRSMLHEGAALTPSARTLWEIQEKAAHMPMETATNLYTDVCRQAAQALRMGEKRRRTVRDAATLRAYQARVTSLFAETIGGLPDGRQAAPAQAMGRLRRPGFDVEKVLLSPRPGSLASANVYVPAGRTSPGPAVLLVVGHTDQGKADPEYQYVAQLLCQAGFVTLVLDPLGEGERFEHYEPGIDLQPIQGCSGEHDLLDWKCKLLGLSLARYFIQDGLAALDYLAARPDVDPARIGLTGHSGGGTQTCLLMLAAADRLACAAPCAYVTDAQAMLACGVDPDNEMLWPGSLAQGVDYVDLLACMAPKPVLFLTNQHDFFPREGALRTYDAACRLWRAAGSEYVPELATACSQHAYAPSLALSAARFFHRALMGREADRLAFRFAPLPPSDLRCTPEGILPKAFPAMRTVHDDLLDILDQCRRQREGRPWRQTQRWLLRALHADRVAAAPEARVYDEGVCGHYAYRCLMWRPQPGHWSNGVLLRDMRQGDGPLPTAIALWPEGLARLAEHAHWLHRAVEKGWQVLVMDLAASGTLLPAPLERSTMYIGWGTMYKLSAYLLQLGDSLFGLRVRQAMAAAAMLRRWPDAAHQPLLFFAQGECARVASLAALLSETPAALDEDYQPYGDIVRQRYHDQTYTHAWILPGVLRHADAPDILRQLQRQGLQAPSPAACSPEELARMNHITQQNGGEKQ